MKTRRGTAGHAAYVARTPTSAGGSQSPGAASLIALQRSAGNASALALMRRATKNAEQPPITFTLPGVVDHAAVFVWSMENIQHQQQPTDIHITRPIDSNSPRLFRALTDRTPGLTATLAVRMLTPSGWTPQLTVTMDNCVVDSYSTADNVESLGLTFTSVHMEQ